MSAQAQIRPVAPTRPAAPPDPPRLGELLARRGGVDRAALSAALRARPGPGLRLGEILARRGAAPRTTVAEVLAEQAGLPLLDPAAEAADPRASAGMDPRGLIRMGVLPWGWRGGLLLCAVTDRPAMAAFRTRIGPKAAARTRFALLDREALEAQVVRLHGPALAAAAADRCPAAHSCRSWAGRLGARPLLALAAMGALAAAVAPGALFAALLAWIGLITAAVTVLRGYALALSFRHDARVARPAPPAPAPDPLPVITLLIPLMHEDVTLRALLDALARSSYPKERLDAIFILEAGDTRTPLAFAQLDMPPWARVVTAPPDALRTKPRAMNFALDLARGEIVGIYDAEDRPEPGQLMQVAAHLARAPADVACVQGYLDFYNTRQNWLSRCFAVEYAVWFRVLLTGVQRLGMPVPLGGTTVFFRRAALEAVGAWDAHNVTEDADLGMRLARHGYRCEMVATTTWEEANCRPRAWVRQRSRWLKGYAMTWVTHMRRPAALWRELGPMGFLGFQLILLGGLTAYLAAPVFWALWLGALGLGLPVLAAGPIWAWGAFFAAMAIGQAVMLAVALRAVWTPGRRHLALTVPSLVLYWPLGALAAWRAVGELFLAPFHWAKTEHGL